MLLLLTRQTLLAGKVVEFYFIRRAGVHFEDLLFELFLSQISVISQAGQGEQPFCPFTGYQYTEMSLPKAIKNSQFGGSAAHLTPHTRRAAPL